MSYLRSFAPWIAFAVVPAWQWGALAALLISVALVVEERRAGQHVDTMLLSLVSTAFFAVVVSVAFATPDSPFHRYVNASSAAVLALMAWGGLAVKQPFTVPIARGQAPEAVWHTPVFYRINVVITSAWAVAFTLSALALAALDVADAGQLVLVLVQVAGFVLPVIFTIRYTAAARARAAAAAGRSAG